MNTKTSPKLTILEYIWIGGNFSDIRSKTKVTLLNKISIEEIPDWQFNGCATNQAKTQSSEVALKPRALFPNPLRRNGYLVLCDAFSSSGEPLNSNRRAEACKTLLKAPEAEPIFGFKQDYFLVDPKTQKPFGYPLKHEAKPEGLYYCSVGAENVFGRDIALQHLQICLQADLDIRGINSEVAPGQWQFRIGPGRGILAADHLWVARYLLLRVAEQKGIQVSFEPMPLPSKWNISRCRTSFSSRSSREGDRNLNGLEMLEIMVEKLEKKHEEHLEAYGTGLKAMRLEKGPKADFGPFLKGKFCEGVSVKIGSKSLKEKCGFLEDMRVFGDCDPYDVVKKLFETCCLE